MLNSGFRREHETTRTELPPRVECDFLTGLDEQKIDAIFAAAHQKQTTANQTIVRSGERASELYLLRRGRIRYYKATKSGEEVLLYWLTPGDIFGLGSLLENPSNYLGSAEAICKCELYVWDHTTIRRLWHLYPRLGENALRIVLKYLKHYAERHVGLATQTAEQRLANVLLGLAQRTGKVGSNAVQIDATNEQLGSLADISPFTTSRLLSGWGRRGLVSKGRQKVFLHAPEALPIE